MDAWQLGVLAGKWVDEFFRGRTARILELGCGSGTIDRAKKYDIVAIEHDVSYLSDYVQCILAPIVDNSISKLKNEKGWYDEHALATLRGQFFDLIIIDGPPGEIGRSGILSVPWLLKSSPCILVDDTHRESESALASSIEEILINVEREDLVEESDWGLRKSTILHWSESRV